MDNNSALRKAEANAKKERIKQELLQKGFEGSQNELETELEILIGLLEEKVKQPIGNTENVIHTFKEKEFYPRTLYEGILKDVYIDQYRLHNAVQRIERTEKLLQRIQELLREYEQKGIYKRPTNTPLSMYPEMPKSPKQNQSKRRFSLPSLPGFVSKMKNTLTRGRSKSEGGRRKRKNKTRKNS